MDLTSLRIKFCSQYGANPVKPVKFLGSELLEVASDKLKCDLRVRINRLCQLDPLNVLFPGVRCSLVSSRVDRSQYLFTPKTLGRRFLLVFSDLLAGSYVQFIVSSDWRMWLLRTEVPVCFYQGTILDGDMVYSDKGEVTFAVFDVLASCGYSMALFGVEDRLTIRDELLKQTKLLPNPTFQIVAKPFFRAEELGRTGPLAEWTAKYPCRGMVLYPLHTRQKQSRVLAWSPAPTADFYVFCSKSTGQVSLCVYEEGRYFKFATHSGEGLDKDLVHGTVCEFCFRNGDWVFVSTRSDKAQADSGSKATLVKKQSIEPISVINL